MPCDTASPLPRGDGPAIQMERLDHRNTLSYGGNTSSKNGRFRDPQKKLIKEGKFAEAFQLEVEDVRRKFGDRYDEAIEEAKRFFPQH